MLYSFCVIPEMIGLECKSSQTSNSIRSGQTYLALSAPFDSRELISNSWPYLAATWRGVFPYISTQSISPPVYGGKRKLDVYRQKWSSWGHPPIFKKKKDTVGYSKGFLVNHITVLDQNLGPREASVHGSHMQGALPFFILVNIEKQKLLLISRPLIIELHKPLSIYSFQNHFIKSSREPAHWHQHHCWLAAQDTTLHWRMRQPDAAACYRGGWADWCWHRS